MKSFRLLAALVGVLSYSNSTHAVLPSDLRRMPVLIEIPLPDGTNAGTGSGVYLLHSNWLFLVSVKHVFVTNIFSPDLFFKNTNALLSSVAADDSISQTWVDLGTLKSQGNIRGHKSHDLIAVRVGAAAASTNNVLNVNLNAGVVRTRSMPPVAWTTATNCQPASKILEGDEALIFGFPTDLFNTVAQQQIDFSQPLIRKGIIAQKNRITGKFVIDTGVFGGNSGGPFLTTETTNFTLGNQSITATWHKIAGLMVQFVPAKTRMLEEIGVTNQIFVYSGYSVAEPIEEVLELLNEFK